LFHGKGRLKHGFGTVDAIKTNFTSKHNQGFKKWPSVLASTDWISGGRFAG
jgi:hypothetical protein